MSIDGLNELIIQAIHNTAEVGKKIGLMWKSIAESLQ